MARAATQMTPVRYSLTKLGRGVTSAGQIYPGGLDQTTPSLELQPGALRDGVNFEVSQSGGYGRIQGYERYDGQTSPSAATFAIVQIDAFVTVPDLGSVVTQDGSGAFGTVAALGEGPTEFYLVLTKVSGTFDATGALEDDTAQPVGTAITATVILSSQQTAEYAAAAADIYRADIDPVPGIGSVLGVVGMVFNGQANVYAFRTNAGNTAVDLYKSSSSGWVQVPFFKKVSFTAGGVGEPAAGETLTQGGVTATIKRAMTQSGNYAGSSAAGVLVITNVAGGNFAAGAATTSGGTTLTLSGVQTDIALLPGGHFQFVKCNFFGQVGTRRIYGCDGVNQAFEFDGETLAPITTGLTDDAPSNIAYHKNILFLSYESSIFYSAPGDPYRWSALDGGGEIAAGDLVTGMISLPASQTSATLAVYLRNSTALLYGTQPSEFNFVTFNVGSGATQYSLQTLFDALVFDSEAGVVDLKTTLNFGNFQAGALTKNILPFILQERTRVIASSVNRLKSQYRVFFSDGYGLWLTIVNQSFMGAVPVRFPNPVFCCDSGETLDGTEPTYFGSSDGLGYVYEMDVGPSFDGEPLDAFITLAWDAIKTPRILKRFRAASIEIASNSYASVSFGYRLAYASPDIGQPNPVTYDSNFASAPMWDQFVWDNFTWDGATLAPTDVDVTGWAENIQVTIASGTNYIGAYNLNSVIHHYSMGRGMRV